MIPQWLTERYGAALAKTMWARVLDRYPLIGFNANNEYPKQVSLMRQILEGESKFNFAIAGNRWGKTEVGAATCVAFALGLKPFCLGGTGFEDMTDPVRPRAIWIVSLDYPASRDIVRPKLDKYLPRSEVLEWRVADQIYRLRNGSIIGLKSQDSGREKFQGVSRDLIWLDEEPDEDIFDECLARTVDTGGKILCTMTPIRGFTWSYDRIWLKQGIDPDVFVVHGSMTDNPYLPKKEVDRAIKQFADPAVQDARIRGLYSLIRGVQVFDANWISRSMERALDPLHHDTAIGLSVWDEPIARRRYVIGADVGRGSQKGDYSAAIVFDPVDQMVVATVRLRCEAGRFGEILAEVGNRYNTALVAPERNDHGIVTIKRLQELHYPNIWRKQSVARLVSAVPMDYGFATDVVGKPLLLSAIMASIESDCIDIPDKVTLGELGTYIWYDEQVPRVREGAKTAGRCGAMKGKHDDMVIALGIALFVSQQFVPMKQMEEVQTYRTPKLEQRRRGSPVIAPCPTHYLSELPEEFRSVRTLRI